MASASPEQQSAARAMKQVKLNKSAKPGKIDRHRASLAQRSFFMRLGLMSQLRNLGVRSRRTGCCTATAHSKAVSSAYGTLRATALQILSVLLKKLSSLFGLGSVACGGAGGGGSTLRGTYSGCDPPHIHFNAMLGSTIDNMVKKAVLPIVVAASLYGTNADASIIRDVEFNQNGGQSEMAFYLQNNDNGVTYDSAELKYDALLDSVAQSVKDNNSTYSGNTLEEIKDGWKVSILSPSAGGEVKLGWIPSLSNGTLDLTHSTNPGIPGFDYDAWHNTNDNASQDEMALHVNFHDQLDFNHNGTYDAGTERLLWEGPLVNDAFKGVSEDGFSTWSSDAKAITVIPEPAVLSLIGLVGVGFLAVRRFLTPDYKK